MKNEVPIWIKCIAAFGSPIFWMVMLFMHNHPMSLPTFAEQADVLSGRATCQRQIISVQKDGFEHGAIGWSDCK